MKGLKLWTRVGMAFLLIAGLGMVFPEDSLAAKANSTSSYTGLVVDARGLGVMPSMSPRIFNTTGDEVYGTLNVDPDYVIEKGIVGYVDSIDAAIQEGIVGTNPLIVRALSLGNDPFYATLVLSGDDAKTVAASDARSAFLKEYRVAIVL